MREHRGVVREYRASNGGAWGSMGEQRNHGRGSAEAQQVGSLEWLHWRRLELPFEYSNACWLDSKRSCAMLDLWKRC